MIDNVARMSPTSTFVDVFKSLRLVTAYLAA